MKSHSIPNTTNASATIARARTEGVSLNNEAVWLNNSGRSSEAITKFLQAITIKEEAYGSMDLNICISLSGLVDAYIKTQQYQNALRQAKRMLKIAATISNCEQMEIANNYVIYINRIVGNRTDI